MLRSRAARLVGRVGVVALAAQTVSACYTTAPLTTDVRPVGAPVVLDITDQGRVHLGSALGESPLRVEGRLAAVSDSTYTLAVTRVEGLRGTGASWSGESYTFRREDVGRVSVRRLSRGRTAVAILGAVGTVILAAVTISLLVGGTTTAEDPSQKPPGGGNGT